MGEIKLHLGCGERDFGSGWDHIDAGNYAHVKWHDVTKLPYTDESVDVIYSSHLIAYFDRQEIALILKEWFRVLKPSTRIKLSTPDWDFLRTLPRPLIGPLYGKMSDPPIYHKTVYSYDELYQVLRAAGFINIERISNFFTAHDQSEATYDGKLISLNVTAIKP
jgi:predicted SAM-dependent methyltransferase